MTKKKQKRPGRLIMRGWLAWNKGCGKHLCDDNRDAEERKARGMKVIAVSRDLIGMGLGHGVEVAIDGLPGLYVVRDKMAKRWTHKIDIYMGDDLEAARRWGRQRVTIRWNPD